MRDIKSLAFYGYKPPYSLRSEAGSNQSTHTHELKKNGNGKDKEEQKSKWRVYREDQEKTSATGF